jgi:predicted RNase H-like HicB family nuclease
MSSQATSSNEQPPAGVLSAYLDAAMRHAVFRRAGEQQRIYAAIRGIPGLWARGYTHDEAARDRREALEWWVLTSVFEHRSLPAFDGLSLEIEEESAQGSRTLYPAASPDDTDPLPTLGRCAASARVMPYNRSTFQGN